MANLDSRDSNDKYIVIDSNSHQFESVTQGFNQRWKATNPNLNIYLPESPTGAKNALTHIIENNKCPFSVKSGGHCYENFVYNESVLSIIDLSLLNEVGCIQSTQDVVYYVEPGCKLWDVYEILNTKYGKTLPGGSCYSVGAGGHVCGGGYGLLSRKYSLIIDYLCGVDLLWVNDKKTVKFFNYNPNSTSKVILPIAFSELMFAIRGSGCGNYGIITRYYFKNIPTAPKYAYLSVVAKNWKGNGNLISDVLDKFKSIVTNDSFQKCTNGTNSQSTFIITKLMHKDAGQITCIVQSVFDQQDQTIPSSLEVKSLAYSLVKSSPDTLTIPLIGTPGSGYLILDTLAGNTDLPASKMNWIECAQTLNSSGPNQRGKYKSAFLCEITPIQELIINKYLTMSGTILGDMAWKERPSSNNGTWNWDEMDIQMFNEIDGSDVQFIYECNLLDFRQSLLQIDSYYGAIGNTDFMHKESCFNHRQYYYLLQFQTYWQYQYSVPLPAPDHSTKTVPSATLTPAFKHVFTEDIKNKIRDMMHKYWIRKFYCEMFTTNDSTCFKALKCYYNYPDVDLLRYWVTTPNQYPITDRNRKDVLKLYFGDANLKRLIDVKNKLDPDDHFKHQLSIPLQ